MKSSQKGINSIQPVFAKVCNSGTGEEAIIDTGSVTSLVKKRIVSSSDKFINEPYYCDILTANDGMIRGLGKIKLQVCIGSDRYSWDFIVEDKLVYPPII